MRNHLPIDPRNAGLLAVAAVCLLLAGCTVGPKYHAPSGPTPSAANYKESTINFPNAEGWKVASPQDALLRGNWWEIFGDSDLDAPRAATQYQQPEHQTILSSSSWKLARSFAQARSQYWPTITANPSMN